MKEEEEDEKTRTLAETQAGGVVEGEGKRKARGGSVWGLALLRWVWRFGTAPLRFLLRCACRGFRLAQSLLRHVLRALGAVLGGVAGVVGGGRRPLHDAGTEAEGDEVILLVDHGSVRPGSTVQLREIAALLSKALDGGAKKGTSVVEGTSTSASAVKASGKRRTVIAVSAKFSNRVDASKLGGAPARMLEPTLMEIAAGGGAGQNSAYGRCRSVVIVPLFLSADGKMIST